MGEEMYNVNPIVSLTITTIIPQPALLFLSFISPVKTSSLVPDYVEGTCNGGLPAGHLCLRGRLGVFPHTVGVLSSSPSSTVFFWCIVGLHVASDAAVGDPLANRGLPLEETFLPEFLLVDPVCHE